MNCNLPHDVRTSSREWPFLTAYTLVDGSVAIVELCGAVDRAVANQLASELRTLVRGGVTTLALDLTGVTTSNHSVLNAVTRAYLALRARGGYLQVVVGDDDTFALLHTAGIDRSVAVVFTRRYGDRLDAALRARSSAMRVSMPSAGGRAQRTMHAGRSVV